MSQFTWDLVLREFRGAPVKKTPCRKEHSTSVSDESVLNLTSLKLFSRKKENDNSNKKNVFKEYDI